MSAFDSLFSNASFFSVFGAPVEYSRGSLSETVDAMDSVISKEQQMEFGASLFQDVREFVIAVSDLADFDGPERGDVIEMGTGAAYELAQVGAAPAWEYDADRDYYRCRGILIQED